MIALVAAAVPVAVVYGGPSAEHDVSIVSGTAIADALAGAGHAVSQVLVDLAGGWWLLPTDHRRDGRPGAAYDAPGSLGAAGTFAAGEATAGIAAADAPNGRLIGKPASLGSSVGIAIAHGPGERDEIVELALRYDARAVRDCDPCLLYNSDA